MRPSLSAVLVLIAGHVISVSAETPAGSNLTPAEQDLVTLMTDYYEALEIYWSARRKYETSEAYDQSIANGKIVDPNVEYIPRLLEFEKANRGEDIGLLALWHVFREAARGGKIDAPAIVGRRQAATRLLPYAQSDLLPIVVRAAMLGHYEPTVYESVIKLLDSQTVPTNSNNMLRYFLATKSLETRDGREATAKRLEALRGGSEPSRSNEFDQSIARFDTYPSAKVVQQRCNAAIRILEELSRDKASPRMWGLEGADEQWRVVRTIKDPSQPLLTERAAAVLFKERKLKVGASAPELEVKLLDETAWRLADHRGKVVIVQFSFTGCGPCEEMYPDLADLFAEYSDNVAILTLMSDKTPQSAIDALASRKFTWSIALDGDPGCVATKWSVSGFPETYVVDREGRITARGLRGKALREKVILLLDNDD
jgi:peroxiredoxin